MSIADRPASIRSKKVRKKSEVQTGNVGGRERDAGLKKKFSLRVIEDIRGNPHGKKSDGNQAPRSKKVNLSQLVAEPSPNTEPHFAKYGGGVHGVRKIARNTYSKN